MKPLIEVVSASIAALTGATATYLLARRRPSDKSVLELWRIAFDRSAFKGPYQWHSDQERFKEAIELTIKCLNTGILQDRKGTAIKTAKPKAQLKNREWRQLGDDVERRLNCIRESIPVSGFVLDPEILKVLEQDREEIVKSLNAAWEHVGLQRLPLPTEAKTFADLHEE